MGGSCPSGLQTYQFWRVFVGCGRRNWCRLAEDKRDNAGGMAIDFEVVGSWVGFGESYVKWVDVSLAKGCLTCSIGCSPPPPPPPPEALETCYIRCTFRHGGERGRGGEETAGGDIDSTGINSWAMAVQAQYPSNVLFTDFRSRNGQVGDHKTLLGVGFGSLASMEEYQAVGVPIQSRMFNTAHNAQHGQQVPSTSPVVFQVPEEQAFNVKRARGPVDLLSLQCKRTSMTSPSDLSQQAPGTVSTGLRLAFEDECANSSAANAPTGDIASTFSILSDDLRTKLQQQRDDLDQFITVQGEHLRLSLAEKRQRHLRSLLMVIEEGVSKRLRDKDLEMEKVNLRNMELEKSVEQLKLEAHVWQSKARSNEAVVATLKNNLQQAVVQSREMSKEGCGDSEADDAESAHVDPNAEVYHVKRYKGSNEPRDQITCKVCRKNVVSILLLPCRHLCLCRVCEITLDACPLCCAMKKASVEVYMS